MHVGNGQTAVRFGLTRSLPPPHLVCEGLVSGRRPGSREWTGWPGAWMGMAELLTRLYTKSVVMMVLDGSGNA